MKPAPAMVDPIGEPDSRRQRTATKLCSRRIMLPAVLLAFLASRCWLLLGVQSAHGDIAIFEAYSRMGVDEGQVAYRDFRIEYPPLAWWFMAAPRAIARATHPRPELPKESVLGFIDYAYSLRTILLAVDFLSFMLLLLIGAKISPLAEWGLPAAYALASAGQPHLIYGRLDVVLLALFLGSIYCWLRSLDRGAGADRWAAASYFCLGLGASFKVIPILFAPFLILADLRSVHRKGQIAGRLSMLAAGAAGPFLIQACLSGSGVLYLFQYHAEREINIDSVWGSVMMLARSCGVECEMAVSHSSIVLTGALGDPLKITAIVLAAASGCSLGVWALALGGRFDRRLALDFALQATLSAIVLSTVFSPQYLTWLVPLVLILALSVWPKRAVGWWVLLIVLGSIVAISGWLFPNHYTSPDGLARFVPLTVALLTARNVALLTLTGALAFCLVQKVRGPRAAARRAIAASGETA